MKHHLRCSQRAWLRWDGGGELRAGHNASHELDWTHEQLAALLLHAYGRTLPRFHFLLLIHA